MVKPFLQRGTEQHLQTVWDTPQKSEPGNQATRPESRAGGGETKPSVVTVVGSGTVSSPHACCQSILSKRSKY